MKQLIPLLALAASVATAFAVAPQLSSTTPIGVQRGTEVELRFNGSRLADAKEILLFSPGVEIIRLEEVKDDHVTARIKVAPDCQLGEQRVRIRCASGVSELRTFQISQFPTVDEKEPNSTPDKAQKIPLNCSVFGTMGNEDVDYYSVDAKKGQRIAVEVEGMRLGRTMFDPYVSISNAKGKVLAKADDTALFVQDCFATIVAPEDGEYLIEIRESSYGGGGNPYRAHIGTFPRPTAVYPAGGKAGETLKVKFIGDATGEFEQTVTLGQPTPFRSGVFAQRDGVYSPSFNTMRVSPFPNVFEVEPNNDPTNATPTNLELPLAFNGIISKKGDVDWFRFTAKRGQQFDFNVYARRIRSPLDSVLTIADAKGNTITSNDDSGGSDSYIRFNVPNDGEFLIKVTDHLGNGGPDYTYRVEVAPIEPALSIYIADTARYDTQTRKSIVVARGNRFASLMTVRRINGVNGDLELDAQSLPTGLFMKSDGCPSGQTTFPVVFEAKADAPIGGRLLDLGIKTTDAKDAKTIRGGIWQNYDLVQNGNDGVYYATWSDKIAVAVVEELPFKINLVEPKMPLVQNGSMDLKIVAERMPGFDEPINVRMIYNPPGVGSLPDVTIPKGENSVIYTLNANGGAPPKDWKIAVLGQATVSNGTAFVSSQLATLKIAEPYLLGKLEMTNVLVGNSTKMVCKLDQKIPFEGKANVKLLGLPSGVTADDRLITKDQTEVVFNITTATNAMKGLHRTLFCSVVISKGDEHITQSVGGGGVIRLEGPKVLLAEAKPAQPPSKSSKFGKKQEPK